MISRPIDLKDIVTNGAVSDGMSFINLPRLRLLGWMTKDPSHGMIATVACSKLLAEALVAEADKYSLA